MCEALQPGDIARRYYEAHQEDIHPVTLRKPVFVEALGEQLKWNPDPDKLRALDRFVEVYELSGMMSRRF